MNRSRRIDSAHVIAIVALVVALGGSAYALTRNEVKSKHIAANAVKPGDVQNLKFTPLPANGDCQKGRQINPAYPDPAAAIDNQGVVHFKGYWGNCTNTTVVTLPAKYRPNRPIDVTFARPTDSPIPVVIGTGGNIVINPGNQLGLKSMEGLSFPRR